MPKRSNHTHWGVNIKHSNFHYKYMNNFTFSCTNTHTHNQGLNSSAVFKMFITNPPGSYGGVGSNRQQWMPGLAQLYKQSCKEQSPATVAQSSPVLIPHYLHSRQPHSSCPCIAFHTPKFNLAEKWTCCITSPGWKSSWHCSPLIIFILRQRDGCIMMYNWFNSHFVQDIFCFLFSLSGIHWTT